MTIDSIQPTSTTVSPADHVAAIRQAAVEKLKAQVAKQQPKPDDQPTPALRPTIQDRIEIDRALLALRAGT